jgi:RNA ligase (TIGR02306 family)
MSLASIQKIKSIEKHPNADALEIAQVLNYKCIVKLGQYKHGDLCVFIEPDTILPDAPWASFYKSKSSRVKAIRLRNVWSMGIIESFGNIGYSGEIEEGLDISDIIGVVKYNVPEPQDLQASGPYHCGIPKTDEIRYQSLGTIPYGEIVDITLKIDGQSFSALYNNGEFAVGGRSFLYKLDCHNNYTHNAKQYNLKEKLTRFCIDNNVNLCIRGESHGNGIQKGSHNIHSKLPLSLSFYSVWLIDERRYALKGEKYYIHNIAKELDIPTVPMLENNAVLTPELIYKYDEGIEVIDGKPFEGVVIQYKSGSFKVINKYYDSKK